MLQIKDIHKQYKTGDLVQQALDGVSLTFRDNEFVAILGPSGSGKTTLLNIIGGLDRYDSGDLVINGVSTKKYTDRDWDTYRNHSIGFVFQSYNLISHQTVLQNVELALTISGISKAERRKKSIEALQKVGLGEQLGKHPNQMSGGQMQRVAIARALVNDPEILLADEPTGALDTQTGIQVMELLKEVAKDRLVIMVTHNPELARQYATRIVNLRDGKIVDDSNPASGEETALRKPDKVRKSSMSFRTSLGLSFRNLLTKKRRTLMTAAAGSIGIIGIALILALSSGVNEYIQSVEEDTLAEYPLQITSSEFDVSSLLATMSDTADTAGDDIDNEAEISVTEIISTLLSQMNSNDLASLKEYIESSESRLLEYVTAIEYLYDLEPEIYLSESGSWRQVNPDSSLSVSGSSILSMFMSSAGTSSFYAMPESESLYRNQYEVMAGRWPESYNECVLVLTSTGSISDYMLYTLGLRDYTELEAMLRQYSNGEDVDGIEDVGSYLYEEVLGITFKVVCSADYYAYDSEYGVWVDKTDNEDYLTELVENGEDLTIVGVVQPAEDAASAALSSGINYPRSLIYHMSELAEESEAVQAQLASPDVNIFTGEPFGEDTDDFDMSSILSIDEEALENLLDISSLTDSLSIDMSSFDFDTSSLNIDLSALELDFSSFDLNLDLDDLSLSLFDFDIDADSLDLSDYLDLSTIDLSSVDTSSLEGYLSDLDISETLDGLTIDISAESVNSLTEDLLAGYQTWLVENPGASYSDLVNDFSSYLKSEDAKAILSGFLNDKLTNSASISEDDLDALADALVTGYSSYADSNGLTTSKSINESFSAYLSSDSAAEILSEGLLEMLNPEDLQEQISDAMGDDMQAALAPVVSSYTDALIAAVEEQASAALEQIIDDLSDEIMEQLSDEAEEMAEEISEQISEQIMAAAESMTDELMVQITDQLSGSMESMMSDMMAELTDEITEELSDSLAIDPEALMDAFAFNMDSDALMELLSSMSSSTGTDYESSLASLGYVDFANPDEIDIYPMDFDAKEKVVAILDSYNEQMEAAGETEKVISYTDLVGTMMSSVTTIINVISYVLIAFVAISLIVSCIMISIITQISVMERTKEIGILRAIGASRRNISQVFNAETFIIGISSGLIGVVTSELLTIPINALIHRLAGSTNVNAVLPLSYALLLVLVSVTITVLSGLAPAHSAAKKDPVIALRTE